jgi:hypothetical protein
MSKDVKRETNINSGGLNILLSSTDKSMRHKINMKTLSLKNILDLMDLPDICKTLCPRGKEHTSFSSTHGAFTTISTC